MTDDCTQIEREEKADREPEQTTVVVTESETATKTPESRPTMTNSRSRSRRRAVSYQNQIEADDVDENTPAEELLRRREEERTATRVMDPNLLSPSFVPLPRSPATENAEGEVPLILPGTNVMLDSPTAVRPKAGGIAFPFKLGQSVLEHTRNASMVTLKSDIAAINTPRVEADEADKGLGSRLKNESKAEHEVESETEKENGLVDGNGRTAAEEAKEKRPERPGIERFETAQEDLD